MPDLEQSQVLRNLHGALKLLIRGAAAELTEKLNVSQPKADVMVLHTLFGYIDEQADLPTMLVGPVLAAIRVAIENEHADALVEAEKSKTDALAEAEKSKTLEEKVNWVP